MRILMNSETIGSTARLAQSAERKALNLVVVGSSPTVGVFSNSKGIQCFGAAPPELFVRQNEQMKRTPTVGLEPTTTRLRALRSAD